MLAFLIIRGGTIQNVLVIAETHGFGACLEETLRGHGYHVTTVETYGRFSSVVHDIPHQEYNLVIATNTSLSPASIQSIIPDIKDRHPHARIIVLSGYYPGDFVADLKQKGVDGFLPLPFEEAILLRDVATLLSKPAPDPEGIPLQK